MVCLQIGVYACGVPVSLFCVFAPFLACSYCDAKLLFLNGDEPVSGLHSQGFTLHNRTAGTGVQLVSSVCTGQCLASSEATGGVTIAACSSDAAGGWSAENVAGLGKLPGRSQTGAGLLSE